MKSQWLRGAIVLTLLFLVGCEDFSSPQKTIGTFAGAVVAQNFQLYEKSLTSTALENYGTADAMRVFAADLKTGKWVMPEHLLVAVRKGDNGWDVLREYSVSMHLHDRLWWNGRVMCRVDYIYRMRDSGRDCTGGNSGPWGECFYTPVENCRISEITSLTI